VLCGVERAVRSDRLTGWTSVLEGQMGRYSAVRHDDARSRKTGKLIFFSRLRRLLMILAALALVMGPLVSNMPSAAAAGPSQAVAKPGSGYRLPQPTRPPRTSAQFSAPASRAQSLQRAAALEAARTGHSVVVAGLETATQSLTAHPDGLLTAISYSLPARVRKGTGWVPVSTTLTRARGGMVAPRALPGDAVEFSGGGRVPMATISAAGRKLEMWWPQVLPRPILSGPSATYRNVLPGVNLVLTATSQETGGFNEVLVITSAKAAADSALRSLSLRVTSVGTRLRSTPAGGLIAPLGAKVGAFEAPPSAMWDTPAFVPAAAARRASTMRATASARLAAARAAGATLASAGGIPLSGLAGPGAGALLAPVRVAVSAHGSVLRLTPDARLLSSPAADFPIDIDPSLVLQTPTNGAEKAYDPVQSDDDNGGSSDANCTGSHFDSSSYSDSPVGFNNYEQGDCSYNDTDRALFRVGIPGGLNSADHFVAASLQVQEAYSSDCTSSAAVTLSWISSIHPNTGWPGPGKDTHDSDVTNTIGPDYYSPTDESCDNVLVENNGVTVSSGFNILPEFPNAIGSSTFTFRLWEQGSPSDVLHRQFANNPDLQVSYFDSPDTPSTSSITESANTNGTNPIACANSPSNALPLLVSQANGGAYVKASFTDPDGDSDLEGEVQYWNDSNGADHGTSSWIDVTPAKPSGWMTIPWSFMSGFANGTVIQLEARAATGQYPATDPEYGPYYSDWSSPCYFAVYPTGINPPTLTPDFTQTAAQSMDSRISFTITASSNSGTVTAFVWAVDAAPPVGTIPASQECTATSATCTLSGGSATLTIVVPSPGPHLLNVYEKNSAGQMSQATADPESSGSTPPGNGQAWPGYTFTGAGDPATSYTSTAPTANLASNFSAALGAGQPFDNTLISTSSDTSCGAETGDGGGFNFDASQLSGAGWGSQDQVTVDGASFTLPKYGSCGPDNLLAAGQTIGTGPDGAQGSALVFLATSTSAGIPVPGLMTGSPDSGIFASDYTAPSVPRGTLVSGAGCVLAASFDSPCDAATGMINYQSGCGISDRQSFELTVPDWIYGPTDEQVISTADRLNTTGEQSNTPKIYAYAVPVDASCTVTSVSLPDVGEIVNPGNTGQSPDGLPALHIFGISLRNTTTTTPVQATATDPAVTPCAAPCSSPASNAWTGAYENPIEDAYPHTGGNQTIRILLSPNISVPEGSQIRIRLTNPGWADGDGSGPLQIGAASIAQEYYQAVPDQTPVPLSFGGSYSTVVAYGADVYSDPLTLPFAVTSGKALMISLWLQNSSPPYLPVNSSSSGSFNYQSASGSGNETEDTADAPFTGTGSAWADAVPILSAVDVTTPVPSPALNGDASPGAPTVVVAGNNATDVFSSSALADGLNSPSQRLAGQLASQGLTTGYGVVDAGIQSNQVMADGSGGGGVSLVARLDHDILAEPDVGTVIIDEGQQDLLANSSSSTVTGDLENAYTALENQLSAYGINVIIITLTPCGGYDNTTAGHSCTASVTDPDRTAFNTIIQGTAFPTCVADTDAAVGTGADYSADPDPETFQAGLGEGDGVNPTPAGYAAMAAAILPGECQLYPNTYPLPPT
jgi:hypothetical protein